MTAYSQILLCLLALIVGALIPVQAATNAALSKALAGIAYPTVILFAVGFCVAIGYALATRAPVPSTAALAAAPRHGYLGGFIVASYVLAITFLAPRLGIGMAIAFIVTGQVLSAALIDQFGLLNSAVQQLTPRQIVGLGLMIAGVFLAKKI